MARDSILDKETVLKDVMDAGSERVVFRAVRPTHPTSLSGVKAAPLSALRTPKNASNPITPTSTTTHPTNRIKNESLEASASDCAAPAPPVLPTGNKQTDTRAEYSRPLQQAINSQTSSSDRNKLDVRPAVRPAGTLLSSERVSPVARTQPAPAAASERSESAQSSATASFAKAKFIWTPPLTNRASFRMTSDPTVQPPPDQHQWIYAACHQCWQTNTICDHRSPTCSGCERAGLLCHYNNLDRQAIDQVPLNHGIAPTWPDPTHIHDGPKPSYVKQEHWSPSEFDSSTSATYVQPHSPPREPYVPRVFHHKIEESSQPFDPSSVFMHEPSQSDEVDDIRPTDLAVREIIKREDPAVLEAGVDEALKVLESFKQTFMQHAASSHDAQAWIESIDKLSLQAKPKRTVVGVVGNTGAGKSSVINAMLDEERLVPTNCMRACTAVVTEMSWNDSNDPFSKYRAEIEFITPADWAKEVATLLKEFLTENGTLSREVSDQNSDAGIAWAKFHAVYPKIARDTLDRCSVASLMAEQGLSVLGTTKKVNAAQAHRFYYELQKYVDSKEKVTKKDKDKDKEKQKRLTEMEYWPLIKVVKIYTKAFALSTGAVIVDLPGVHDSNAARAAVAQGYIKQCTGLWIVAPITRAVDDKAAKTLLGDSFKTQLKYDGGFSSVTFICSKTDDISITEAIDTLELEEEVESFYDQQAELKREIDDTQSKIDELEETRKVYLLAQREYGAEIEKWEELQEQMKDGQVVFAPTTKPPKRKKIASNGSSRKRQEHDHDFEFVISDDEASETEIEDEDDDEGVEAPREPLTEKDIKTKLKNLRESRKTARREGLEIRPQVDDLKPRICDAQAKMKAIKAEISRICISGRNDYSKRAIQQDFAAGIKELDQENAAEEDENNFDPDEEMRDYDEVAKALPVFCVSSRAYQKMCGRLQKDDAVPGFNTPEETEMPQLQAHCKKLTEAGRIQNARAFLLSLCQQLTTFTLWASNNDSVKMTDDDKRKQSNYVGRHLGELEKGLESAIRACLNTMKKELNVQIFDKYPSLIQDAINAAPGTAQKWGQHKADGGLPWATYKAIVRRDGAYQSPTAGSRDFNSEL